MNEFKLIFSKNNQIQIKKNFETIRLKNVNLNGIKCTGTASFQTINIILRK
jgi:hypothetical protein